MEPTEASKKRIAAAVKAVDEANAACAAALDELVADLFDRDNHQEARQALRRRADATEQFLAAVREP